MEDNKYNKIAFQIIANAGEGYSILQQALSDDKAGVDEKIIDENLKKANEVILIAHKIHADLIHEMASKEIIEVSLLLVHAEDHFVRATVLQELIPYMISQSRTIRKLVNQ